MSLIIFFRPKTNLVYERHRFLTRKQLDGESIQQFLTDLKNKGKLCNLDKLEDSLICSVLIIGLHNDSLRERLLEEPDITLKKTERIFLAVEESRKQGQEISYNKEVNAVRTKNVFRPLSQPSASASGRFSASSRSESGFGDWTSRFNCYKCGTTHQVRKCPAFGKQCGLCGGMNHFQKVCLKKKLVHSVQDDNNVCIKESNDIFIGMIQSQDLIINKVQEWNVKLLVNNKKYIQFKLDTGAMSNTISYKTFLNLDDNNIIIRKSNIRLTNYSNNIIPVVGECQLKCSFKNHDYMLKFIIVAIDSPALLGLDSCIGLDLIKKIDLVGENIVFKQYAEVFNGIGCISGQYGIKLKENAQPVVHSARKVPFPLTEQFKNTLNALENDKIICKVSYPTDWVNPIVLVVKKYKTLRICLDPLDLNKNIRREHSSLPTFE